MIIPIKFRFFSIDKIKQVHKNGAVKIKEQIIKRYFQLNYSI